MASRLIRPFGSMPELMTMSKNGDATSSLEEEEEEREEEQKLELSIGKQNRFVGKQSLQASRRGDLSEYS